MDESIHVTWGPEGEKLSEPEKDAIKKELLEEARKNHEEQLKAQAALRGTSYCAIPIDQLMSIHRSLRAIMNSARTNLHEISDLVDNSYSPDITKLKEELASFKRAIFHEADSVLTYARQWLPREIQEQIIKRNQND